MVSYNSKVYIGEETANTSLPHNQKYSTQSYILQLPRQRTKYFCDMSVLLNVDFHKPINYFSENISAVQAVLGFWYIVPYIAYYQNDWYELHDLLYLVDHSMCMSSWFGLQGMGLFILGYFKMINYTLSLMTFDYMASSYSMFSLVKCKMYYYVYHV